jgi:predicted glycoside hydrolase/deacetylase ChbG (UPF0249 family)
MMLTRIIADDAGALQSIDSAVCELLRTGRIDGVAAFTNFDHLARSALLDLDPKDIGIHFNLSTGPALQDARLIPSLVDAESGHFVDPRCCDGISPEARVVSYLGGLNERVEAEELRFEFAAQMERFRALFGRDPAFASVHQDLDRNSVIRAIADEVSRLPCRETRLKTDSHYAYSYQLHQPGVTPKEVDSYLRGAISGAWRSPVSGTHELIVHPAETEAALADITIYRSQRVSEFRALSHLDTSPARTGAR